MPTEKELLAETVKATAALFQEGKALRKLKLTIARQEAEERQLAAAEVGGETEPEDET